MKAEQPSLQPAPRNSAPVSVVIPCYRCAATVRRAVDSVLGQSLAIAEIILVDDASGDDTLPTLYQLQREHEALIRVIAAPNNVGAGGARNLGWNVASQPWIAFLDADDAWHPHKVAIQFGWLSEHVDVVLCAHESIVSASADWPVVRDVCASPVSPTALPFRNTIPTRTVMLRTRIPYRFAPGKRHAEDFALWLMIALSGSRCAKLAVPLACTFRPEYSGQGLSSRLWRQEIGELDALRIVRNEKLLGRGTYLAACAWSLAKYVRRLLIRIGRTAASVAMRI